MNTYDLSRNFFDWCFENPEKISPNHIAIYFFAIENCNRLGWKSKFGFPTQMAMDAVGIKKHETYIRYFNDLCDWGFFKLIEKSKNQYSSNIISINSAVPKNGKALGKAIQKHRGKQIGSMGESTGESNRSIDKQETNKPINLKHSIDLFPFQEDFRLIWDSWIQYKKIEHKKTFKRIETEQAAFKLLLEKSKGNPLVAEKIIQQSIANNWQGLFELKTEKDGTELTKAEQREQAMRDYLNR